MVPKGEFLSTEPLPVMRDDIDYNLHMNNAQYIRMACEYLPEDFDIKRVRVEYKKPAKLSELIYPQILQKEDKIFVQMNSLEACYAVIEFTGR